MHPQRIDGCDYVTIRDNVIRSNLGNNVELTWVSRVDLIDNNITSPGEWSFANVNLYDSDDCRITENYIASGDALGINVGFCRRCTVTNNTIEKHRVGIEVYGCEDVTYEPNVFVENEKDIESDESSPLSEAAVVLATMVATAVVTAVVVVLLMRSRRRPGSPAQPGIMTERK